VRLTLVFEHHFVQLTIKGSLQLRATCNRVNAVCGLISDYYYVTSPIHSLAKVNVVIANHGVSSVQIFAILMLVRMNPDLGMD